MRRFKMAKLIFEKNPESFIKNLAEALKKVPEFEKPEWVNFVKSGMSKERPPTDDDFWYIRSASILRQLYIKGVVGVGKLRTKYGGRKNRGTKRAVFVKASGKMIRVILQQAETAGLVEKISSQQHGRRLTQKGRDFLDSIEADKREEISVDDLSFEKEKVDPQEENFQVNEEDENGEQESEEQEQ